MRAMDAATSGSRALPPVGARVVVRHRLPVPDPRTGATLTDVVGLLVHADDEHLLVRTRRGEVGVPLARVTAVKEIPPAPSRRGAPHLALSVDDLQRVMVGAWPPVETAQLGDWLLRAAGGFTRRANSAMTAGDPGIPLDDAVDAAQAWYRERDLAPALTVAGPLGWDLAADPLGGTLLRRGYARRVATMTLTAAVDAVLTSASAAAAGSGGAGAPVTCTDELTDPWFTAYTRYRAAPPGPARAVLAGSPATVFAHVEDRGEVLAIGRLGVAAGWGGLAAMWTAPHARRRGLATAVLRALAAQAREHGVRSLHLQTDADNPTALATYRRHGFVPHHDYVTLHLP